MKDDDFYPFTGSLSGEMGARLGYDIDMSRDGQTIVAGAPGENGFGKVRYMIAPKAGWMKVDPESIGKEIELGYLGIGSPQTGDEFGAAVAISQDDSTIVVGAPGRVVSQGSVYLFNKPSGGWLNTESLVHLKVEGLNVGDRFGESVAVSKDGSVIAVGAPGLVGQSSGNIYVFTDVDPKTSSYKVHKLGSKYVVSNAGISIAISADGKTIVAGSYLDSKDERKNLGSVLVYKSKSGKWTDSINDGNLAYKEINAETTGSLLGFSVDVTDDGSKVLVGIPNYNNGQGDFMWMDI